MKNVNTFNELLIEENKILCEAFMQEDALSVGGNETYYHTILAKQYSVLIKRLYAAINFEGNSKEEFKKYISTIQLNGDQLDAVLKLKKDPLFIKAMGENAIKDKSEIEELLFYQINNEGIPYFSDYGVTKTVKTEAEINEEANIIYQQLSDLVENGTISQGKFERLKQSLYYIFNYYISVAKGEQLPYELITDEEYRVLALQARRRNTTFANELEKEKLRRRYLFEDAQREQEENYIERKGNTL